MSTRAIKFLEKKKIPFQVIHYDHEEKGAVFAAASLGFPLDQTIKTLVADIGQNRYVLALMPGSRRLNMKRLAQVFSAKRAEMADAATAEKITGYLTGGISPFGCKKNLPAVMDASLMCYDKVMINAGQRGSMLVMSPQDIISVLQCPVVDCGCIVRERLGLN